LGGLENKKKLILKVSPLNSGGDLEGADTPNPKFHYLCGTNDHPTILR
jgi:hypothetical protein